MRPAGGARARGRAKRGRRLPSSRHGGSLPPWQRSDIGARASRQALPRSGRAARADGFRQDRTVEAAARLRRSPTRAWRPHVITSRQEHAQPGPARSKETAASPISRRDGRRDQPSCAALRLFRDSRAASTGFERPRMGRARSRRPWRPVSDATRRVSGLAQSPPWQGPIAAAAEVLTRLGPFRPRLHGPAYRLHGPRLGSGRARLGLRPVGAAGRAG